MALAYYLMDFCRKNKQYFDRAEENGFAVFYFKNGAYLKPETFNKELIDNFIKENQLNAEWDETTPMVLRVKIAY